jgi:hypothetical protein
MAASYCQPPRRSPSSASPAHFGEVVNHAKDPQAYFELKTHIKDWFLAVEIKPYKNTVCKLF